MKTLGDQPCFVTLDGTISFALDAKNPFVAYQISSLRVWNKSPCAILQERIKLKIHGSTPFWNFHNCSVTGGFGNGGVNGSKKSLGYRVKDGAMGGGSGFSDVVLRASNHGVRRDWVF